MGATERAGRVDRDLVEQAQRGDREAFGILAGSRGDVLFGVARRNRRGVHLAEDAGRQSPRAAWREPPRRRDPDRFDAWLQRTLVHACYAEARRKRAWSSTIRVLPVDGLAGPDPIGGLVDRDEVERGFRRLPTEQRAILVLHHYLGLGLAEIADVLDVPAGTARSRLHYAHRAMRALLEADARPTAAAGGRLS